MQITRVMPGDTESLEAVAWVANAAMAVDAPWQHPVTAAALEATLRHGWDGEPPVAFLTTVEGVPVGLATYDSSEWDNLTLAWFIIEVHPAHRCRGHGTAVLEFLLNHARSEGRTTVGIDGWDGQVSSGFAAAHGFDRKARTVNRRHTMATVAWHDIDRFRRQSPAEDYDVVRRVGATPTAELGDLAQMTAAINDAPTDDLAYEDEVYTAERVRNYEQAQMAQGQRLYRLTARHRESGTLAGQTVVVVESARPWIAHQHDTSVTREHRGHRLGLRLKTDMLQWLRECEPQVQTIDTWNAQSNDYMVAVNEQLGYEVLGRVNQFQRAVTGP